MSKQKRGRPEAESPAPPEVLDTENVATTEVPESPKAAPAPAYEPAPIPPPIVRGLARAVESKWGVPRWLTFMAAWTGSRYHSEMPGTNNACGIMAVGTMQHNAEGWAWFGNIPIGYDQFGFMCHKLGLDYSDRDACVKALAERCPKITTFPHTNFTEA